MRRGAHCRHARRAPRHQLAAPSTHLPSKPPATHRQDDMGTGRSFKTPGPVTLTASGLRTAITPRPGCPARHPPARDIIADPAAQLHAPGVTARMHTTAGPARAVLSLPQLTPAGHPAS
jgi:hypothetical protein